MKDIAQTQLVIDEIHTAFGSVPMPDQGRILRENEPFVEDCERLIKGRTWKEIIRILFDLPSIQRAYYFDMHWFLTPREKHYLTPVYLCTILNHLPDSIASLSFSADLDPGRIQLLAPAVRASQLAQWYDFYGWFSTEQKDAVIHTLELCKDQYSATALEFWKSDRASRTKRST